jgi:hypothetical protein
MAGTKAIQHDREWMDKIADQAAKLLKEEGGALQQMRWANKRLSEANLLAESPPPSSSPELWAERAIAENLDLRDEAIPHLKERGVAPENAETFESLIFQLIPSEGGL